MRSYSSAKSLALSAMLAVLLLSASSAQAGGRAPNCYLLAVGVDEYLNADKIRGPADLSGLANDARNAARMIEKQEGFLFGKVYSTTLLNADATRANIRDKLAMIMQQGKARDVVVLYFAGHGGRGADKRSWGFAPYDSDPKNPVATTLTDRHILEAADELASQGKVVVVIVDSCNSGQLGVTAQPLLEKYENVAGGGLAFMLSCGPEQLSYALGDYGAFGKSLADSLTLGDVDKDGAITLPEIKAYTKKHTTKLVVDRKVAKKQDSEVIWSKSIPENFALAATKRFVGPKPSDPPLNPPLANWVGRSIVPKYASGRIDIMQDGTRTPVAILDDTSYRVLEEDRGLIRVLTSAGVTGWLEKVDAVLVDEAVAYFTERLRATPNDGRLLNLRAMVLRMEGRLAQAVQDYDEALRISPQVSVLNNRAALLYAMKEYGKAIEDYTTIIKAEPTLSAAYYGRGVALVATGEFDKAIEDFSTVLKLEPRRSTTPAVRQGPKEFVNKEGRFAVRLPATPKESTVEAGLPGVKAKKHVVELKVRGSDFVASYLDVPMDRVPKDKANIHALLDQLLSITPAEGTLRKQARLMMGSNHGQERLIELTNGDKRKERAYLVGNRVYWLRYTWTPKRGGTLDEADTFLMSFRVLDPKVDIEKAAVSFSYTAAALNGRGDAYRGKKDYDKAIEDYTAALAAEKALPYVYNNRGLTYFLYGDYAKALADFDASEKLDPENAWVFKNRARLLATAMTPKFRDGKKAVAQATKAMDLERYPNADFHETLAAAYAEAGNFKAAVESQEYAIQEFQLQEDASAQLKLKRYQKNYPYREFALGGNSGDAERAFRNVERYLFDADTVRMSVFFAMKIGKDEEQLKGTAFFAPGGRGRVELSGRRDDEQYQLSYLCDGASVKSRKITDAVKEDWVTKNATPMDASALLTGGAGLYGFIAFPEIATLSEFVFGEMEEINGREAQRIEYKVRFKNFAPKHTFSATVWIDRETELPLRRIIANEKIEVRILEAYEIRLDDPVDPKEFVLPSSATKKDEKAKEKK